MTRCTCACGRLQRMKYIYKMCSLSLHNSEREKDNRRITALSINDIYTITLTLFLSLSPAVVKCTKFARDATRFNLLLTSTADSLCVRMNEKTRDTVRVNCTRVECAPRETNSLSNSKCNCSFLPHTREEYSPTVVGGVTVSIELEVT